MFRRAVKSWRFPGGSSSSVKFQRAVAKVLWLAYTVTLAYGLTLAPLKVVVAVEKASNPLIPFPDPGASARHFLLFFGEGALSALALGWDGLAFSVAFGGCSELIQYFIPWRTYDVHDLTANFIGSLVGFYFTLKTKSILSRVRF